MLEIQTAYFDILGLPVDQEFLDFCKEEQILDEEFVASTSNKESRDADLCSTESELEDLTQGEEVKNSSKENLKQGNYIPQWI